MKTVKPYMTSMTEAPATHAILDRLTSAKSRAGQARAEAAAVREEARRKSEEARREAREAKSAEREAAIAFLKSGDLPHSLFKTRSKEVWFWDRLSPIEREWADAGIELARAIDRVTEAKRKLLHSYEKGAPVNIDLGINMQKLSDLMDAGRL